MRITRPRATSLSQIRINTDLDMGAHNILLGAGQTVDGRDVSGIEEGAQKNVWQLIDSYIDINTGTIFSYDSGVFTAYDFLKIIFHLSEQAAASNGISLILNNETGAIYYYEYFYSTDHIAAATGYNSFEVAVMSSNQQLIGEILIRGIAAADNAVPGTTHIAATIGGDNAVNKLLGGYAGLTANTVTRAKLYSGQNATGHLLLYGSNI